MKVYTHIGAGHYIGSAIIVIAEHESDAIETIRNELNKNGLQRENLKITEQEIKPCVLYVNNGDY